MLKRLRLTILLAMVIFCVLITETFLLRLIDQFAAHGVGSQGPRRQLFVVR
jgi:hypothetical protein